MHVFQTLFYIFKPSFSPNICAVNIYGHFLSVILDFFCMALTTLAERTGDSPHVDAWQFVVYTFSVIHFAWVAYFVVFCVLC